MSTRRSRQLGNRYIKAEDIQNIIYDSDEENTYKIFTGEREDTNDPRNKGVLKSDINRDIGHEDNSDCLRNIHFSVIDSQERESGKLNGSVAKCYGSISYSIENNLNNSVPKEQQIQGRTSVFDCFESITNKGSDTKENLSSGEFKQSEHPSKDFSSQEKAFPEESSEEESSLFQAVRKRPSPGDRLGVSVPKKIKVELDKEMTDAPAIKPLKIELELEKKRQNEPMKRRHLETITKELDEISRRWNDSYSRFKPPFQWGSPVTKNCSEKWDFHYLPQKIFEAYQKRSEGSYSPSSRTGETSYEQGDSQVDYRIVEARSVRIGSDKVDEEGSDALDYEQYTKVSCGSNPMEDDLHTYNTDGQGKMTLRSRNQTRNRQDGRVSNDGMSEQSSKEKASKKGSFKGNKDQKKFNNSNRQTVVDVERYNGSQRQYQSEEVSDTNRNFPDNKGNFEDYGGSSQMNVSKSHYEENSAQGPMRMNDDKVACPICQGKFDKNRIESHANSCATAAFCD